MANKKADKQKSHDDLVSELAKEWTADKWAVKANVEGAEKPAKIGAFTPDIDAKKGDLRRICQILTEKDFKGDKEKYIEFNNYCDEYDFHFYVVDKDGKRRQINPKTLGKK